MDAARQGQSLAGDGARALTPTGHLCRGCDHVGAVVLAALTVLAGCTTTHVVLRGEDPQVREQMDAVAPGSDTIVHLRTAPGAHTPPPGYRVSEITREGFMIEPSREQSLLVAPAQVVSLSRYNHARGARDGVIVGGVAGFVTGLALGILVASSDGGGCADGCPPRPDPAAVGLRAGALFGLIGAVVGAGIGAAAGHEDRFVVGPP